jgi:hypothetical protein
LAWARPGTISTQDKHYAVPRTQFGSVGRLPWLDLRETRIESGAGGHIGGQDVVRVTVQVLAGSVIPHRGARVGMTSRDLDVAQVDARVEHGRDEGMTEHMRVRPGDPDAGGGWRAGPSGHCGC